MGGMRAAMLVFVLASGLVATTVAQTPQPIPRPGGARPPQPTTTPQTPATTPAPAPAPAAQTPAVQSPAAGQSSAPSAATLGLPVYPTAQFLGSYDAGRGQRYYMYGTAAAYAEVVAYYRAQLKDKGDVVFEQPPTQMFQVGKFREETMAFPPGVTVKDWTWGGSQGYPNPKPGAQPSRFPTLIQFVPVTER